GVGATRLRTVPEVQSAVCLAGGQIGGDASDRVAVEPELASAGRRLRDVHLGAIQGVQPDEVGQAVDVVAGACPVPEVGVQPGGSCVVVDLPNVVSAAILTHG